jgi:p-aminobenzoyl-glutamate transporter AbgT
MAVALLLIRLLIAGGLLVYCARGVMKALETGIANAAGTLYRRAKSPVNFWFTIACQLLFTVLCTWLVIKVIGEYFLD